MKYTHYRSPNQKDVAAILELHLRTSLKQVEFIMAESWIVRMQPNILEAFRFAYSSQETTFAWTLKDVTSWAKCLKYYPIAENEMDITRHLLDTGRRLFHTRFVSFFIIRI